MRARFDTDLSVKRVLSHSQSTAPISVADEILRHPSIRLIRARHDNSTSNLKNHALKCAPAKGKNTIEDLIPGAKYSKARMRYCLIQWVVRRHRPYSIVEDTELLDIFKMLFSRVEVPSARTISRDVQEVFEMSKKNVIALLKVSSELLSYMNNQSTDGNRPDRLIRGKCTSD